MDPTGDSVALLLREVRVDHIPARARPRRLLLRRRGDRRAGLLVDLDADLLRLLGELLGAALDVRGVLALERLLQALDLFLEGGLQPFRDLVAHLREDLLRAVDHGVGAVPHLALPPAPAG